MLVTAWEDHRKLRFIAVGGWNTAFAYLAYFAVFALLHDRIHYLLVSTIAHVTAVTNAFICQRWLVFRTRTPWLSSFMRFNLVQLGVLAGSLAGMTLLVEVMHLRPFLSQMVVMSAAIVASYLLNLSYTFRAAE